MSEHEYEELWHYSEQFTKDKLQRSELITMAWKEGEKLGARKSLGLMKSVMHFRAKEIKKRSAFPADEVGKSGIDAWNHERVSLDQNVGETATLRDFLLPMRITPLNYTIANDFIGALTPEEHSYLDQLTAGFKLNEISRHNHLTPSVMSSLQQSIREKAVAYL